MIITATAFINIFPAALSEIHLSNGKRELVFMQMSHIGTPKYYDEVQRRLQSLVASGYILYEE
jgi:hypothetical protein